jgi:hypothetical protein
MFELDSKKRRPHMCSCVANLAFRRTLRRPDGPTGRLLGDIVPRQVEGPTSPRPDALLLGQRMALVCSDDLARLVSLRWPFPAHVECRNSRRTFVSDLSQYLRGIGENELSPLNCGEVILLHSTSTWRGSPRGLLGLMWCPVQTYK